MNEIILKFLSLGSIVIIIFCITYIIINLFYINNPISKFVSKYRMDLLFLISLIGVVGSLLLSFYFKLAACELCWYQRLFLFSTPVIAVIALIKKDLIANTYIFWLSLFGLIISFYHSLLQTEIFISKDVFCDPNAIIDCAIPAFTYFGFVTVPVISFSVFLLILVISYESKV